MIDLSRQGAVFVLRMDAGENRFSPDFIKEWNRCLDEVEACDGPKALVTTGTGKFYSNGLDLDWMLTEGRGQAQSYLRAVLAIMGRVLVFPAPTVVAANGHAFGAGGQLLVAHDHRLMRSERGFFCMPEVDIRAPLHPGMTALLAARLPGQTLHEVVTTGRRYGGEAAAQAGIVEAALPEAELLPAAVARAAELAPKAHPVLGQLKRGIYEGVLAALARDLEDAAAS